MALTLDLLHYEIGQKHVLNCLVPRSQLLLQAQPVKSYANVVQDPFYNVFKRMKYGGTTTCPQGYRQITDVKTCEEAKEIFEDKFDKLSKISLQMSNLNISPSKAQKFGIKIV